MILGSILSKQNHKYSESSYRRKINIEDINGALLCNL